MARRLPVIQNQESDDALAAARPRAHWVFIGAGLSVTIWAPLALLALPVGAGVAAYVVGPSREPIHRKGHDVMVFLALSALPIALAYFVSALLAGALVGRFGGKSGPREAALGGVVGAGLMSLFGLGSRFGLSAAGIFAVFTVLSLLGSTGGAIGAVWGTRSRR